MSNVTLSRNYLKSRTTIQGRATGNKEVFFFFTAQPLSDYDPAYWVIHHQDGSAWTQRFQTIGESYEEWKARRLAWSQTP